MRKKLASTFYEKNPLIIVHLAAKIATLAPFGNGFNNCFPINKLKAGNTNTDFSTQFFLGIISDKHN